MMQKAPLLVFDSQYMAYRSWFAMSRVQDMELRGLSMAYGFFESVRLLKRRYATDLAAFCFDAKKLKRRDMFPGYKKRDQTEAQKEERKYFHDAVDMIRDDLLPRIGFSNVFLQEGYEADDLIATICKRINSRPVYIISSDEDLYQCLKVNVRCYAPQKDQTMTERKFVTSYGIEPCQWVDVKAIAGCSSDRVPGVSGVGEGRAIGFLRDTLKKESKAYAAITSDEGVAIKKRNLELVRLPLYGAEVPKLVRDDLSIDAWEEVGEQIGIDANSDNFPAYG